MASPPGGAGAPQRPDPGQQDQQLHTARALELLDEACQHMQQLFSAVTAKQAAAGIEGQVQAGAAGFVQAVAGIQQSLGRFVGTPGSCRQQLEQEVQELRAELNRADQLLSKTDYVVQQWQAKCQELRTQHEAALTDGVSGQPMLRASSGKD